MPFERLINNVKQVRSELIDSAVEAVMEHKEEIIDLNTSQLEQGKLSTGANVSPPYANSDYAKFKKSIGSKAPFGVPDLKLEGDFYKGWAVTKVQGGVFIESTDEKAPQLEFDYTSDIYGVTEENKPEVADLILPSFQNKVLDGLTR